MATYRTREGDMVDEIAWRHYGDTPGAAEVILAANPGLAGMGETLPVGVSVELPVIETAAPRAPIRLWD